MGKHDIIKHSRTQSHRDQAKSFQIQSRLQLSYSESSESLKKLAAELKMAVLTATSKSFTIMYIINNSGLNLTTEKLDSHYLLFLKLRGLHIFFP